MKHIIYVDDNPIVLIYDEINTDVDVNEITKIDYSNLFGESVTISTLLNKVGQWKAELEAEYETKKLERHIMEANLEKRWRREANKNTKNEFTIIEKDGSSTSIKITEKSISSAIICDDGYIVCKKNEIEASKNLGYVDSLFWSIKSKDQKLNNLLPKVTPKEFYDEIIEGTVNLMLIKKPKRSCF